jgi:hypothetical protein
MRVFRELNYHTSRELPQQYLWNETDKTIPENLQLFTCTIAQFMSYSMTLYQLKERGNYVGKSGKERGRSGGGLTQISSIFLKN